MGSCKHQPATRAPHPCLKRSYGQDARVTDRVLILVSVATLLFSIPSQAQSTRPAQATVVWISIDGFRGDYLARFRPPTLSRLAAEGAFTSRLKPVFPSLTFPNHVAQYTGMTVDRHGIPANTFFDSANNRAYDFPDFPGPIRAEPIWITAKRQGVRAAVIDWPMSQGQTGQWKSDYFADRFDRQRTDRQRLDYVTQLLKDDRGPEPLRLIMTYASNVDTVGHRYGPDSAQLEQAVRDTDELIGAFVKSTIEWFDGAHSKDDELFMLFTSDHGMQTTQTLVNAELTLGAELAAGANIVLGAPLAMIYLNDVAPEQRAQRAEQIVARFRSTGYVSAWKAADVPADFHFSDPSRIGQVVALLPPGYAFTTRRQAATQRAVAPSLATHGYDPNVAPNMLAGAIIWRYRHRLAGGKDLGPIDNTQWHATVARWLGIQPATGSDQRAVELP